MKKIVLKTYGKIIAWILTCLGIYTSCHIEGPVEYGVPNADFVIKGTVIDKTTRQPINNMAVIHKSQSTPYENDTVKSDANGNYKFDYNSYGINDITIYTSDTDSDLNGLYHSDTIRIKKQELKQIKKSKGWYSGKFEGIADFELTPDNTTTE